MHIRIEEYPAITPKVLLDMVILSYLKAFSEQIQTEFLRNGENPFDALTNDARHNRAK